MNHSSRLSGPCASEGLLRQAVRQQIVQGLEGGGVVLVLARGWGKTWGNEGKSRNMWGNRWNFDGFLDYRLLIGWNFDGILMDFWIIV